ADAGDAAGHAWLRADPVHLRADISGVRLMAHGDALALAPRDVEALLPALRPLFGDAGFELDAPTPSRWYLRLPPASPLPRFTDPGEALGEDMFEHLDHGPEARRWRVLGSEAQVLLHNHPWNTRRAASGALPVNGLWFWGGGALPGGGVSSSRSDIHSPDPTLRALARAACRDHALPMRYQPSAGDVAYDLVDCRDLRVLEEDWLQPALRALGRGRLGALCVDAADGSVLHLRRWHRLRVWRRPLAGPGA
ncbi:MAG TPA: phosphoglycerate mutase, partial [Luteimonas sp.]|nr:phosphoglycerate mutase [Luteimonas sp.]